MSEEKALSAKKQDYLCLILSFILPFLIMGTAFALNGIYPFGKWQILISDLYHQYYPFFSDLWYKLREGSSLMWSWTSGGGINYIAQLAGYASPLNFLIVLFPHEWLREVLVVLLLIKLGLCGLCFSIMLRYFFKRSDISLPMFSLFYALCAFTLGYYYNIMWFETIALLPLVVMGTHALVRKGHWRLYTIAMALSILFCYHIALFTCIFTVIVFIAVCVAEKPDIKMLIRRFGLIAVCSIIAIGLTAVVTLPTFLALQNVAAVTDDFPDKLWNYFNYFDILGNFIAFTPPTILEGIPNVYCGLLSILLLGPYIRTSKIPAKEKIICLSVLAFLIVSCNQNVLNFIWHGFHYPISLPYRFSHLISFTIVIMAYRAYTTSEEIKWQDVLAMTTSGILFHIFALLGNQNSLFMGMAGFGSMKPEDIMASAALGAAYIILYVFRMLTVKSELGVQTSDKAGKSSITSNSKLRLSQPAFVALLFILVLIEFTTNTHLGISSKGIDTHTRNEYPVGYEDIQKLLDMRGDNNPEFYRTEKTHQFIINDPALYGYDGISVFSSTATVNATHFMHGIGIELGNSRYTYKQATPLTDAILSIRYMIGYNLSDTYWNFIGDSGDYEIYENKFWLPFGFMVNNELAEYQRIYNEPIHNQNEIFKKATGQNDDLYTYIKANTITGGGYDIEINERGRYSYSAVGNNIEPMTWEYEVPADGAVFGFVYIYSEDQCNMRVVSNGELMQRQRSFTPILFSAGEYNEGDVVSIVIDFNRGVGVIADDVSSERTVEGEIAVYAAQIDHELFKYGIEILSANTLELTEFSDTNIKGIVNTSKDGLLYTSIPYEKGWRVYVDGIESDIVLIDNAMLAVPLTQGTHEVEFKYFTNGLIAGIIITGLFVLSVIVINLYQKENLKKYL